MNDLRRRAGHRAMRIPAAGLALLVAVLTGCGERERIEGWPTYKHDAARTGATSQKLRFPLSLRWRFTPPHAPVPAWPAPGEERARSHLDNTHHVCAGSGMVYFGSPVDNKVYALDARTGEIAWTFFTEGPVRFAPTFWNRRIYFGSDDGFVYCLRSTNGDLLWKYRPGPSGERLLGNGRMISRWPVRTGVLVDDGVAYVGAGVFPYEGIYVCALNAADGSETPGAAGRIQGQAVRVHRQIPSGGI
jgi:outer membrane protein assembly factor BamB